MPSPWKALASRLAWRPELSIEQLALLVSVYFALFCNATFFRAVEGTGALDGPRGLLFMGCLFVAIAAINQVLLCLVLSRPLAKPALTAILIATALAVHFMGAYTIYLDTDMLRNILHTDGKESSELVTWGLVGPVLLFGVLPSIAVWRVRLRKRPFARAALARSLWVAGSFAVAAIAGLVSFQDLSALMRNHKPVRYLVTPANYMVSLANVALDEGKTIQRTKEPVGIDAVLAARPAGAKPRLLVLVIGETVRAQNWGLNGYARQTTPQLAARDDVINFPDVTACGSSTEVSLPCMFSPYGRRDYDADRIKHSESLLHVLERAGVATLWRDNQTGCKGVCEGLAFASYEHATDPAFCDDERCLDTVLLDDLKATVSAHAGDVVMVLHQLGNHGPSYYRRYPDDMRRFTPACETPELGRCTRESITNAYDNAILATDDLLARTIALLSTWHDRDTALFYVSDHGESLGENGLYLHGVPYAIAPDTQTRVPMLAWFSPAFAAAQGLDTACVREAAARPASHDNLFPSVLGLMQVRTAARDESHDLFAACTRPGNVRRPDAHGLDAAGRIAATTPPRKEVTGTTGGTAATSR
ncbi:phosphoethanolamine transferase [Dokdonella sp. MW10]|uniref:phosphoethanolamine transferase n=1 Tax=Dokdonella sp. MW10 TaxID=2992926 RepID=UPI003F80AC54